MEDYSAFEKKLNDVHQWPCPYIFKCIVPAEEAHTFRHLFKEFKFSCRASSSGRYLSFTIEFHAKSSTEVITVYRTASAVPGAMVL